MVERESDSFPVKSKLKFNTTINTGARKGPTEKSGASPARSRRCKGERASSVSLKPRFWEGEASDESKSEELPVWNPFLNPRATGRR